MGREERASFIARTASVGSGLPLSTWSLYCEATAATSCARATSESHDASAWGRSSLMGCDQSIVENERRLSMRSGNSMSKASSSASINCTAAKRGQARSVKVLSGRERARGDGRRPCLSINWRRTSII